MTQFTCDGCGACCRTFPIFASADDAEREPRIAREGRELATHLRTADWRFQLYPLPFRETCGFLDSENRCEIYDSRPDVCRRFEAGSPQCQEARRRGGFGELEKSESVFSS
ncbi:MAG: YkgJ family cysteine cluster protein [Planctomycetes bacterium]|nr:YkgJ family cysteine cluster protein [Planctomycetota bacterium]